MTKPTLAIPHGPIALGDPDCTVDRLDLSETAVSLLKTITEDRWMMIPSLLLDHHRVDDAFLLTSLTLPLRDCVWWGCLCAWHGIDKEPGLAEREMLGAAVDWVRFAGSAQVRTAGNAWRQHDLTTPAACCARAAELAGVIDEDGAVTSVGSAYAAAKTILGAADLVLSSSRVSCSKLQLVVFGIEVADGRATWE